MASVAAVGATCALGGCFGDDSEPNGEGDEASTSARPNFVVVMTDDQALSQFSEASMPSTVRFFEDGGSDFRQAIGVPPLCCPARAGFITGQYAHNHGVLTNDLGYQELRDERNTLPVWLDAAGYRTGFVGKYLNGYPAATRGAAPGWDDWFALVGEAGYFGVQANDNGTLRDYDRREYSTDTLTAEATRFVERAAAHDDPFFLWLAYTAPHTVPDGVGSCEGRMPQPATAADYAAVAEVPLPQPPEFNEADVSDKGRWVRRQAPVAGAALEEVTRRWRCGLAALRAVDRGFESLATTLGRLDELENTVVVFLSDNGYFFGEHRIPDEKHLPYRAALSIPMLVRVPASLADEASPSEVGALVSNVDLAPTIVDYAGIEPCSGAGECRTLDGRSLRLLLEGGSAPSRSDRAIPIELDDDFTYRAFRTGQLLYMEMAADRRGTLGSSAIELYDLHADSGELENRWNPDRSAAFTAELAERLAALSLCRGTSGPRACE